MAIRVQEHVPLGKLTTLKIGGTARYFVSAATAEALAEAVSFAREKQLPLIVLGGGSNVLISDTGLNAVVVQIVIRGIEWESPLVKGAPRTFPKKWGGGLLQPPAHRNASTPTGSGDPVLVIAGAGENWDALVAESVKRGFWGIENLSGIPGTVGAAPIQNIGAYGTEIKDVLEWVEVFDSASGETRKMSNGECIFGYRDSIFKHREGKSLVVTRVALRLSKDGKPNLQYKDLKERFRSQESGFKKEALTPTKIRKAVLEIRSRKFPDLATHGTAGSFFKNPIISKKQFDELKKKFPELPGFPLSTVNGQRSTVKIPLAWILDNICGFKGYTKGNVALFERQPIVLVNLGGATAEEIKRFAEEVIRCVKETIGISVEYEVQELA